MNNPLPAATASTGPDQPALTQADNPADPFANLDPNQFVEPRFIPVDRERLPLLTRLTKLHGRLRGSIAALKPARQRLGHEKGTLLDEVFRRKYPTAPVQGDPAKDQRSWDFSIAWFRRNEYQRSFLEYELLIANLAEDAHSLQECIQEIIDGLASMGNRFERDLTMVNLHAANRLLFVAQEQHSQAVAHLKAQPNDPASLPALDFHEAVERLRRDGGTRYWTYQRCNPPEFPIKDSLKGLI